MTDFEKYIKEQRMQLDSDRPRQGHEERFLQKLERLPEAPVRKIRIRHVLQVAASLAIILTSSVLLIRPSDQKDPMAGQEIPAAMMEADFYYASQVDRKYDQIRNFSFENEEEKTILLNELQDFGANPDDERVINALIRHYQLKLEVMDQIIIQLDQIKSETSEQYEKESI